jgi:Na+-transporting NADH:ubiquinone oxidoreductase subunit A
MLCEGLVVHLKVKKGLSIPMAGEASGEIQELPPSKEIALNLTLFEQARFKLLAKPGDSVKVGQPLLLDKASEKRCFVSPAGGVVKEVRRGMKRRILSIVISRESHEEPFKHETLSPGTASREEILDRLLSGGLFSHIRMRPFNLLANPDHAPRSIFIKAVESAPYLPPPEYQVKGYEEEFQLGLDALARLTTGRVHLVRSAESEFHPFVHATGVQLHTVEGPHPAANQSVHIHEIDPVRATNDIIWTLHAHDVVSIGRLLRNGLYHNERVIAIAGNGILPDRRGFFRVRSGSPIADLLSNRNTDGNLRLISGDPLTGQRVEIEDFLGFNHFAFSVIPENSYREPFHFLRPGLHKYTATRAYLSSLFRRANQEYEFTTNQHGEHRAFVDGSLYQKVMPMRIPVMQLVKALLAEDFELAEQLGLLEVIDEDFALPTFICPSKVEISEMVKEGIQNYAAELFS